jgi:DNA-binding response OmpR family regulator
MAEKILIVDDEKKIIKIVSSYLKKEGFEIFSAEDGKNALEIFESKNLDLIILDLMLPKISGEDVCSTIRRTSDIPIIMLTAKGQENEKIEGLNIGADDYLVKPFSPRELVARVKAILRRSDHKSLKAEVISFLNGDLKIYPSEMKVTYKDDSIGLTTTEFNIFYYLVRNSNQVLSRDQILDKTMGIEFEGFDRTIDVHIKNIRKKLNISDHKLIETVYGAGYRFVGE